jgi:uncharacterized protein with GYD domain
MIIGSLAVEIMALFWRKLARPVRVRDPSFGPDESLLVQRIDTGDFLMAKFLIKASYTPAGAKALVKEGGTRRMEAIKKMVGGLGGKVESFYFALGDSDVYTIVDVPDTTAGAALSLAVNASGAAQLSTVMLMTPAEVDAACKKTVDYRAPGQ